MFQPSAKAINPMGQLGLCLSLAFTLTLATGCGVSVTDSGPSSAAPPALGRPIGGHVHGGQQPITGSTVTLWTVGASGYGSNAKSIASTTTDSNGNFSFAETYTCSGTYAYLTASGGDPGGSTANSAIKLLAVLAGPTAAKPIVEDDLCGSVESGDPSVNINEVSTVTAIYALAQFFNPSTESIGSSSTNPLGLANAFNNVASMMNIPAGTVNATYTPYGYAYPYTISNYNITATTEQQKIYLIADILAACVNSTGPTSTTCSALFGAAVPPPSPATTTLGSSFTYPTATDTLQAAYYMAVNPINATTAGVPNTTNMTNLYDLAPTINPYPSSTPQPTDWTIALTFGSTALCTDSGCTAYVISAPTSLIIDEEGDAFFISTTPVANLPTATSYCAGTNPASTYTTCNVISALMPYGGEGVSRYSGDTPITGLGFDPGNNANQSAQSSMSFSLYTSHNAGSGTSSRPSYQIQYSYEFGPGSTFAYFTDSNAPTVDINGVAFAGDSTNVYFPVVANGYVYSTHNVHQGTGNYDYTSTTTVYPLTALNGSAISGFSSLTQIAVDESSKVWVTAPGGNTVYSMPSGSTGSTPTAYTIGLYQPTGIAIDHSNNAWVVNSGGNTGTLANGYIAEITAGGTIKADTVAGDGGVDYPAAVAIDGAGNVWVASTGTGTSFTGETVSEFANASAASAPYFTALSPSAGFAHSYNGPGTASIAVDLSGNVWVANSGGYATSTAPGTVTVILGAAVPTYTPLARAIQNSSLAALP